MAIVSFTLSAHTFLYWPSFNQQTHIFHSLQARTPLRSHSNPSAFHSNTYNISSCLHWLFPFIPKAHPFINSSPTLLIMWPLMFSWSHFWGYLLSSSIFSPSPYCQLFSTLTIAFNIHAVLLPVFKQTFLDIYPYTVTTSLFRSIAIQTVWKCLHSPFLSFTFCSLLTPFQSNFKL